MFQRNYQNLYQINGNINYSCGLINFWPINNDLIDIVGGANMTQVGTLSSLVADRLGNLASAINFNGGYYRIPPGVYFNGDFTVTLWANLVYYNSSVSKFSRILCLTNLVNNNWYDPLVLTIKVQNLGPELVIFNENLSTKISNILPFSLNTWHFLAFNLKTETAFIYIDGVLVASNTLNIPRNVVRSYAYFSYDPVESATYSQIDFIKFYNRALTSSEILTESSQLFNRIPVQ